MTFPGHSVPLSFAAICVNHDEPQIFDVRGYRECPMCASDKSLLMISRVSSLRFGEEGERGSTGGPPEVSAGLNAEAIIRPTKEEKRERSNAKSKAR